MVVQEKDAMLDVTLTPNFKSKNKKINENENENKKEIKIIKVYCF